LPTIYGSVQTKRLPKKLLDLRPCNSPKALQDIEPLQDFVQLVDSHKWDPDVVKFTTLSHRWSNEPHLTTKTENISNHYLRICTSDLCQTFQDAIFVTRALGIRYLWIDALCIIQGDNDDWAREAGLMGEIYANSVCTIAAHAFGDDGGSGFLQSSLSKAPAIVSGLTIRSRKCENDYPVGLSEKSQDYSVIATPLGNPNADIDNSALTGRGWVKQERLLSPVILHFTPQRVYWARSAGHSNLGMLAPIVRDFPASRREGMHLMGEASSSALMRRCAISKVTPYSWYLIIQEYSSCTLSKEKDKLYAIQGIALLMQTFTADEYHSGLWLSWVHMGLLWSSTNRNAPRPSSKRAPSWSWVSVDGPIQYFMDYLEIDSVFKECPRPGMDFVRLDDWQLEVDAILETVTVCQLVYRGPVFCSLIMTALTSLLGVADDYSRL
jgi:hypothetical protein